MLGRNIGREQDADGPWSRIAAMLAFVLVLAALPARGTAAPAAPLPVVATTDTPMPGAAMPGMAMPGMAMPSRSSSGAEQDAGLARTFYRAGGGLRSFHAQSFVRALARAHPGVDERVRRRVGDASVALFVRVLDAVVARQPEPAGDARTAAPDDVAALDAALYRAGAGPGTSFDIERLFDRLFGHAAHERAMHDIEATFGPAGEIAYHRVFTALVTDAAGSAPGSEPVSRASRGATPPPAAATMPGMAMPGMTAPGTPVPRTSAPGTATDEPGIAHPSATTAGTPAHDSSMAGMGGTNGMRDMTGMTGMPEAPGMRANANGVVAMTGMHGMADGMTMRTMPAVTDVGSPMSREASGTAWLPDSTTTFGHMTMRDGRMFMTHAAGFVRYSDTFGQRGSRTLNAPNWYMAMASQAIGPASQVGARAMVSTDFATVGGYGYPELFQSGESYRGSALHDHQHPHELVSELALTYSTRLSSRASAFAYAGYPGEPALGPPTYMHRLIAYDMADSPIGHHWQDSTHITFGVATAGISLGRIKAEASGFTGREPDEIRTNFDRARFDSVSGRLSWNPSANLATQVSFGFIKSPEVAAPAIDQHRTTASMVYDKPLGLGQFFTASAVWGQNYESDGARSNAYLLEADLHRGGNSVYGRAEFVQKSGRELALDDGTFPSVSETVLSTAYPVGAYALGFVHDLPARGGTVVGLGAQLTLATRPAALVPYYGRQTPLGAELFARLRPTALR